MRFKGNAASDPGSTFPAGDYFLTCTGVQDTDKEGNPLISKPKPNGKGSNPMWILELTVSEGQFKDRKLWHYLVFIPEGQPAHGMALSCLKAFGIDPEGENEILPEHLHGVTVKAAVKVEEPKPGSTFPPKNVVAKWYHPEGEGSKPGTDPAGFNPEELERQAPPPPPPAAKPASAAAKKPLWGKK